MRKTTHDVSSVIRSNLPRNSKLLFPLVLLVICSSLFLLLPALLYLKPSLERQFVDNATVQLQVYSHHWIDNSVNNILECEASVSRLSRYVTEEINDFQPQYVREFNRLVQRDPDGALRSRKELFDAANDGGIWIPKHGKVNDSIKSLMIASKLVFEKYKNKLDPYPPYDYWYLPSTLGEVIYCPLTPTFIYDAGATFDYLGTEWMEITKPEKNPEGKVVWTSTSYDPVMKEWMISAVAPVEFQNRWSGTVGQDILISKLLEEVGISTQTSISSLFWVTQDSAILFTNKWKQLLQSRNWQMKTNEIPDKVLLADLNEAITKLKSATPTNTVHYETKHHIVTISKVPGPEWMIFSFTYKEEVIAPVKRAFKFLWYSIAAAFLFSVIGIFYLVAYNSLLTHRTQIALKQSHDKLQNVIDTAYDMIIHVDLDYALNYANHAAIKKIGYSLEEFSNRNLFDIIPQEYHTEIKSRLSEVAQSPAEPEPIVFDILKQNGEVINVEMLASPIYNGTTRIGYQGIIRDTTLRNQLEYRLQLLTRAIEQSPVSIIITNLDGDIEYVNQKFVEVSGYSKAEVLGKNPRMLKSNVTTPETYRELWSAMARHEEWRGELYNRRKDGSLYRERVSITPVTDSKDRVAHFLAVKEDITQQKSLEEQLHHSQRMETIGKMAGGIAHDFNNLIGVIIGRAELSLQMTEEGDPMHANLEEILHAGARSANLTRQLLTFARKQTVAPIPLDLNQSVENVLNMLRRLIGENIQLQWIPTSDRAMIKMDPSQVDQILANLAVNARDAIDGKGKLTVKLRVIKGSTNEELATLYPTQSLFAELSVTDTGCGMSDEVKCHVFEPFFTTKKQGHGTGLGLATVYGIVKQNDGHIQVTSTPGAGSTFYIYFPIITADEQATIAVAELQPVQPPTTNILLVEDEVSLLHLVEQMLEGIGHTVVGTDSAHEAIRLIRENPDRFDLLVTDVIMPEMNGIELYEKISEIVPGLKCLFISGYTSGLITDYIIDQEGISFLPKPFSIAELSRGISQALRS